MARTAKSTANAARGRTATTTRPRTPIADTVDNAVIAETTSIVTSADTTAGTGKFKKVRRPGRVWTDRERMYLEGYIERVAKVMRLTDWTIKVKYNAKDEESYATNQSLPNQKHCTIGICPAFFDQTPFEQTQTIVHELLHCHNFGLDTTLNEMAKVMVNKKGAAIFAAALDCEIERATDAIADVIAPFVELCSVPEPAKRGRKPADK